MTAQDYENLYQSKLNAIIDYIYAMTQSVVDSQDIAQDAFLAIWENVGNIDTAGANQYLYKTAYTKTIDYLRKTKPQQPADTADDEFDPDYDGLHYAITQLKPQQSAAIYLHYWKKLSYDEIAKEMNCSVEAVNNYLHRAKNKLRILMRNGY